MHQTVATATGSLCFGPSFDPPLFSPHVCLPYTNEKKTFGPREYSNRLADLLDKQVYAVLEIAQKYKFTVLWKRKLEIQVHEARDLAPQFGCCCRQVRCKVEAGDQVRRTQLAPRAAKSSTVVWNETLQFKIEEPCNLKLVVYTKKCLLPNDVSGHITITPNQMIERSTISDWFPFDTTGSLRLSISLSAPEIMPFKFTLRTPISLSFRDCQLLSIQGEKIFTIIGAWPKKVSILAGDFSILTVANKSYDNQEKIFNAYLHGQQESSFSITWYKLPGTKDAIYLEGLSSVTQIIHYKRSFKLMHGELCVACANHSDANYELEIRPCQNVVLLIAAVIVVAKLLESM